MTFYTSEEAWHVLELRATPFLALCFLLLLKTAERETQLEGNAAGICTSTHPAVSHFKAINCACNCQEGILGQPEVTMRLSRPNQ